MSLLGIKQALKKCTQFAYKQSVDTDKKYKYFLNLHSIMSRKINKA